MSEIETRVLIEKLAPLDGTAKALARWLAAQSFAAECRTVRHPYFRANPNDVERAAEFEDWMRVLDHRVGTFAAALLVRALAAFDVEAADHAAAEIQRALEDGEEASDITSRWLSLDGVDAEQIVQAVQAERAEVPA